MVRAVQPGMKPTTPMHGARHSRLKPVTPLRGSNRPKQAHSRPQRRHRFHHPHQPRPERRRQFHEQPANAPGFTTTRPHVARHETHSTNARQLTHALETRNTNARRLTLALETRDTTARLQPPKTGPFTPAKATPVSHASQPHCHLELCPAQNRLSFTGSGCHPREGRTLTTEPQCFTRVSRNEAEQPSPHDTHVFCIDGGESLPEQASGSRRATPAARIPTHATPTTPLQQTPHARHTHPHNTHPRTRTTRGGRARKEEWGYGR